MISCSNCGTDNPDNNSECMVCSNPLTTSRQPPLQDSSDRTNIKPAQLYFEVKNGRCPGQRFPLDRDELIVGRNDHETGSVDIDLSDQDEMLTVSRQHLRCIIKNAGVFVEDLSSTNGTYINAPEKIEAGREYALHPGDVVALGHRIVLKLKEGDS